MFFRKKKTFRLSADQIVPLAIGHGACFASNMITIDGRKVAFMYREQPDHESDSGWRFMSGYEPDDEQDDPSRYAIYDVNTIANYDRDIIPLLNSPIGSVFERPGGTGPFVEVHDFQPPE